MTSASRARVAARPYRAICARNQMRFWRRRPSSWRPARHRLSPDIGAVLRRQRFMLSRASGGSGMHFGASAWRPRNLARNSIAQTLLWRRRNLAEEAASLLLRAVT